MPTLARLAARGEVGRAAVIPPGMPPGSDVGNMSILGYDPAQFHTGRAPIEAAALGLRLPPDRVAYRCNLSTVGDDGTMVDFAGGHPTTEEAAEVIRALDAELGSGAGAEIEFHPGVQYRHILVAPAEWADADCTPAARPVRQAGGVADRSGRRRSCRRSWTPAATSSARFGLAGEPGVALGPGLPAADAELHRADGLRGRARDGGRPHPRPRRAHRHRGRRGARARRAGSTRTTRASATPRSARSRPAPTCSSSTSRPPTRPATPGNLEEKVKALEDWDRRILTDLVDGPRRDGTLAHAAPARPPHPRRAQDPHHRLGALPPGRLRDATAPAASTPRQPPSTARRCPRPRAHGTARPAAELYRVT